MTPPIISEAVENGAGIRLAISKPFCGVTPMKGKFGM
jgi:hypothetical protein